MAKAFGISQLVYVACMLTVPEPVVKTVQEKLFVFLWKNRQNKKSSYYQPVKKGESICLIFAQLLSCYPWLGLVDYWACLTINGRQFLIISFENMAVYFLSSNTIMMQNIWKQICPSFTKSFSNIFKILRTIIIDKW